MNETKSCENCKHLSGTSGKGYTDYYFCSFVNREYIQIQLRNILAPICKHYAEPEPSEFEKLVWKEVEKTFNTHYETIEQVKAGFSLTYSVAEACFAAGRKVGRKQRGKDDAKIIRLNTSVNVGQDLVDKIHKLDEGVDDG